MAGPFDYTLQVANPFQQALAGYKTGLDINQVQAQQQAQQVELQQKQAAMQAQQRTQQDLYSLSTKPNATGADYAAVMARNPSLSKQLGESWATLNTAQQQSKLQQGTQAYAAIQAGRVDLAEQLFSDQAVAARNSGDEATAKQAETMAKLIKEHPDTAKTSIALSLSSHMGPDKFAETFAKLGGESRADAEEGRKVALQPAALEKATADAKTATVGAKFAESKAVQDLKMGEEQIKKWAADTEIAKMNSRIAAMNAATSRADTDLKRQELGLKVQEAVTKRDDKLREKVATAESGAANIDNMLNTIQRIQQNPRLNDVLGAIEGRLPAFTNDQSADAVALIDTLGSQAFLAQIPNIKGMGALSNAEGEKLQAAFQNLSRKQSETQFRASLNEATRLLNKGRENLAKSTGVRLGAPDTPAAPGARPPLSSFQR
jgi:hypothetical protein